MCIQNFNEPFMNKIRQIIMVKWRVKIHTSDMTDEIMLRKKLQMYYASYKKQIIWANDNNISIWLELWHSNNKDTKHYCHNICIAKECWTNIITSQTVNLYIVNPINRNMSIFGCHDIDQ